MLRVPLLISDSHTFKTVQITGVGGYTALKNSFIITTSSTILVTLKLLKFYFALISKPCLMGV
jgi:hypothetical protein